MIYSYIFQISNQEFGRNLAQGIQSDLEYLYFLVIVISGNNM